MSQSLKKIDISSILKIFKKPLNPAQSLDQLLANVPDVFSKDRIEPENYKPHTAPDPNDIFAPAPQPNPKVDRVPKGKAYIPKSPFSKAVFVGDKGERAWYYVDEADQVQGPFTSIEMDSWYDSGYFFNELAIRYGEKGNFLKLIDVLGKFENTPATNQPHYNKNYQKPDPANQKLDKLEEDGKFKRSDLKPTKSEPLKEQSKKEIIPEPKIKEAPAVVSHKEEPKSEVRAEVKSDKVDQKSQPNAVPAPNSGDSSKKKEDQLKDDTLQIPDTAQIIGQTSKSEPTKAETLISETENESDKVEKNEAKKELSKHQMIHQSKAAADFPTLGGDKIHPSKSTSVEEEEELGAWKTTKQIKGKKQVDKKKKGKEAEPEVAKKEEQKPVSETIKLEEKKETESKKEHIPVENKNDKTGEKECTPIEKVLQKQETQEVKPVETKPIEQLKGVEQPVKVQPIIDNKKVIDVRELEAQMKSQIQPTQNEINDDDFKVVQPKDKAHKTTEKTPIEETKLETKKEEIQADQKQKGGKSATKKKIEGWGTQAAVKEELAQQNPIIDNPSDFPAIGEVVKKVPKKEPEVAKPVEVKKAESVDQPHPQSQSKPSKAQDEDFPSISQVQSQPKDKKTVNAPKPVPQQSSKPSEKGKTIAAAPQSKPQKKFTKNEWLADDSSQLPTKKKEEKLDYTDDFPSL